MKKEIRALCIGAWDRKEKEGSAMSEEFKKEEINGEAAEETKADKKALLIHYQIHQSGGAA